MTAKTKYTKEAKSWTEAHPIGNGSIGAMVFGGVKSEKISLNHDTLWSGIPHKVDMSGAEEGLERARKYVMTDRYAEAHRCINENCLGADGQTYLLFGDMKIEFRNINDKITGYVRELDLATAKVDVSFEAGGIKYRREYFVSYPDDVLAVKFSADRDKSVSFDLMLSSPLKSEVSAEDGRLFLTGVCPTVAMPDGIYGYSDILEEIGIGFRGGVSVVTDGTKYILNDRLCVRNAETAILVFSIKTSFNGYDRHPYLEGREYMSMLNKELDNAEGLGWDTLYARHIEDFGRLFNRVRLDLGTSGREDMPTDERIKKFNEDKDDISLYTLLFDFGRYLAISSARRGSLVANLQGIWNDSVTPPWKSGYTLNINTEMNQWPLLMCGLYDCFEPFVNFMKDASVSGEYAAKTIYGAQGFVLHHNTDIWMMSTPVSGDARYAFWNGAAGWLCRSLFEYYEYTGDKEYLTKTCYPIMKKAAQFYLDILCDRGDGYMGICPQTSPENGFVADGSENIAVAKWATMTETIVYDLFSNCLTAIDETETDSLEFRKVLENALNMMKPFEIGGDGRLMEWNKQFKEYEPHHRHISHLYGLHPANLISVEKTPKLAEACRKTLEKRGDGGTGWSLAWKVNFYARLNDGDHALRLVDMMLKPVNANEISYEADGGIYPNMFDAHPPFQIDGNFGVVSGIIEMLIRNVDEGIKVLPALPAKWKNGSLCGIHVKGNKILDIEWRNGKLVNLVERSAE